MRERERERGRERERECERERDRERERLRDPASEGVSSKPAPRAPPAPRPETNLVM